MIQIQIASDNSFFEYLSADVPDSIECIPVKAAHRSRHISSDLLLFGLSIGASVPLNLVAAWLWSKIEARRTVDPTVRVNIYVNNVRLHTREELIRALGVSSEDKDGHDER